MNPTKTSGGKTDPAKSTTGISAEPTKSQAVKPTAAKSDPAKATAPVDAKPQPTTKPVPAPAASVPTKTTIPAQAAAPVAQAPKPQPAPKAEAAKAQAPKSEAPKQNRISLEFVRAGAHQVCVAGSFNEWKPEKTPLVQAGNGRWVGNLNVKPGRYEYLFVVDGQWVQDPNARESVQNPYGGQNSVLVVSA